MSQSYLKEILKNFSYLFIDLLDLSGNIPGMISKRPVKKINLAIHPTSFEALQKARRDRGLSMAVIVERALHDYLKIKAEPGVRQLRGRKPCR